MENTSHASEQLIWMVSNDLRPMSPRRSSYRKTPTLSSSTWRAQFPLNPGCLLLRLRNHPAGCFSFKSSQESVPSTESMPAESAGRVQAAALACSERQGQGCASPGLR